jgi:hypothetical protein
LALLCPFQSNQGNGSITIDCKTTACQVWDTNVGNCGANNSAAVARLASIDNNTNTLINNTNTIIANTETIIAKLTTLITNFNDMIGTSGERDAGKSLIAYLKKIVGVESELDFITDAKTWKATTTYNNNDIVAYLGGYWTCVQSNTNNIPSEGEYWTVDTNVVKTKISIIKYLNTILGVNSEKDVNKSLLMYLNEIVGTEDERDAGHSLLKYLNTIIGVESERDVEHSLLTYLNTIVGIQAERDTTNQSRSFSNYPVSFSFSPALTAKIQAKLNNLK